MQQGCLRPISILARVAREGLAVIDAVYPDPSLDPQDIKTLPRMWTPPVGSCHEGTSEIVLGIDVNALAAEAERLNGVIEVVPQVGDVVAVDEPLFNLYGGAAAIADRTLRAAAVLGPERTMEQDPTFALRIVIDIALKALSPAINDPTTAVLAIDQLHRLLRAVGRRNLRRRNIGQVRTVTRDLSNAQLGGFRQSRIQRNTPMRFEQSADRTASTCDDQNLVQTLPTHRHRALHRELSLLDREIEKHFNHPEELALARVADSQGLGGHPGLIHQR